MTEEIWKPVVGYEGLYEVSSYGRVRSLRRGRILTGTINRDGYVRCHIKVNGVLKSHFVHRLVAEAFIPNPDNLSCVNHKDEVKINNSVENLEWCDRKYNNNYGSRMDKTRDTKLKNGYWSGLSKEEYNKKWYQENKDKRREYMKKWRQENNDKINEYQIEYRRKKKAGL